ncbi:glycosyltransferase family 2 protein [Puniceibacterium confluentis]|uniref:glycosyltransferase family 2 protein n=1 Tax=Puniceibacterium confluentis TaxID=1958944 RepID=UPI001FE8554F|nr:glycosyltransferase family 2 protein [Puniceibacterium confluentis]
MSTPVPRVAVIIPHFNDVPRLARCLDALMPQLGAGVELLVVDNASSAPLDPVRAAWPELRIVTEPLKGAAMARNRGVAETTAPHLFFLDSDCVPAPDWLAVAQQVAARADVTGGTVTVFDETPPPRSGAEAFETVFAFDNRGYIETQGFSVTANLLTTRAVFTAVGPFSAGRSEDLDWCRRATARGFSLVHEDSLRVAHPTRSDWPALQRKWRRLTAELWGLQGRSPGARLRWGARALMMPLSILAHAPRVLRAPGLRGPGERGAALGTLARQRLQRCGWMLWQALGGRI